jgi:hypothetical protein
MNGTSGIEVSSGIEALKRALAEVLGRNQGPTKLDCCDIDSFVLADRLRGNSSLKTVNLRVLGQTLWQRSLGAMRARPGLIVVIWTMFFSRMGCAETVAWRLKSLRPRISYDDENSNRAVIAIASALKENKGLVDLDLMPDCY